jgi:hypothetical protein
LHYRRRHCHTRQEWANFGGFQFRAQDPKLLIFLTTRVESAATLTSKMRERDNSAVMGVIGIAVLLALIPHNSALEGMANNQPRIAH